MSLIRPQQDLVNPKVGEHYYEGIVVDNQDSERLGRVKIRIAELHGTEQEIPDSSLPWAMHFRPTFLGGGVDLSLNAIPRVGSKVTIQHVRGDIHQPVYMFELADNSNRMSQAEQNYPDSYVLRDSDDNYWHVDLVDNKLDIKFNGDECLEITANRNTTIGQNDTENIGGNKTKTVGGDENNTIIGSRSTEVGTPSVNKDEIKTVHGNQTTTVDLDRNENISGNLTQSVTNTKTITSTSFVINTSANVAVVAGSEVTVDAPLIKFNGGAEGVVTSASINHVTGLPHGDASSTVLANNG